MELKKPLFCLFLFEQDQQRLYLHKLMESLFLVSKPSLIHCSEISVISKLFSMCKNILKKVTKYFLLSKILVIFTISINT